MSELVAALVGAVLAMIGTIIGIKMQFKKQDEDRDKEYRNDLVSMIDIMVFKASKVRNNALDFNNANLSKENTLGIYSDIEKDYLSLDQQLQSLIIMMSHHIDQSNVEIQSILSSYQPLEELFNKFKVSQRIYRQRFDEEDFDRNAIAFSKRKFDKAISTFINDIKVFSKERYNHDIYKPKLNELINKNEAQKYRKHVK
ncbi:type I secretion system protein [Staphylococcus simulans]|uniref:type I secretion system protein n=1 Tax=Staphylococcus simulans TaxID=1286 RepID=UPI000D1E0C96|nr:type I secretion system protein [Staphylococcus simulans]PTI97785.1 type I secretion system protein [Staphylococcus simulans]PTJ51315.1 type I secretion system protein [Staphylococcus simulans]UXR38057.1 type I secretion system protein [Staphylococcus simulans]